MTLCESTEFDAIHYDLAPSHKSFQPRQVRQPVFFVVQ